LQRARAFARLQECEVQPQKQCEHLQRSSVLHKHEQKHQKHCHSAAISLDRNDLGLLRIA
jgi:hypothetical protein